MQQDYTISAIATAIGEGGIGIVRLSGERAVEIAEKCFMPAGTKALAEYEPRRAIFGRIYDECNNFIDEAICIVMRAPHSYTCEDVVELQCHGGILCLRQVLELTYRLGARPAEPGEFTKRAFMNGRLDLTQAQSVMDMIEARTQASLKLAGNNLQGKLSAKIADLRHEILAVIAHLEASIDFPEDDIEDVVLEDAAVKVLQVKEEVDRLLASAHTGKILRDGIKTAIVGLPNAGKSSLMNIMLGEERAIVTNIPGTTRDSIEEYVNIDGVPLRLIDTAGIRETDNLVEQIGVERAYEYAKEAELVLAVFDGTELEAEQDESLWRLLSQCQGKIIVIINKSDLALQLTEEKIKEIAAEKEVDKIYKIIKLSAKEGTGLRDLQTIIRDMVFGSNIGWQESVMVSNARQEELLRQALILLEQTLATLRNGMSEDFVVIDLRSAWDKLGDITGESLSEDIIDEIFSRFCIGK